jgi:hypothetical protein
MRRDFNRQKKMQNRRVIQVISKAGCVLNAVEGDSIYGLGKNIAKDQPLLQIGFGRMGQK